MMSLKPVNSKQYVAVRTKTGPHAQGARSCVSQLEDRLLLVEGEHINEWLDLEV